jgi:hypothetical protein
VEEIKQTYNMFSNLIKWSEFRAKFGKLSNDEKWRFVRACSLYQQAVKCKKCDQNVSMLLLCSCAESLQLTGKRAPRRNFKELYLKFCPVPLRNPPIRYSSNKTSPPTIVPFEKGLDYIYSKFRCLYTHQGMGRLQEITEPGNVGSLSAFLYDVLGNDSYSIDLINILDWFIEITQVSLFHLLYRCS